jgi:hypothetical protein
VKVLHRTESQVVLDGLAEGTEVALIQPDALKRTTSPAAAAPPAPGAGR